MATELIKVEEFTSLIKSAPDALSKNKNSIMACNQAGQSILDTIEGEGMTDTLDVKAAEYLKKVSVTIKNMQARRSPITQIFDRIRSIFTSDEKAIDPKDTTTIPGKIVQARDQYAAKKRLEEKKRQEEAIRRSNIENEKTSYKAELNRLLFEHYNEYFSQKTRELEQLFNTLSLNAFDLKSKLIREFSLDYPREQFNKFSKEVSTIYLDQTTRSSIRGEVVIGKYAQFAEQFKFEMEDLRQSFIDRLGSKKQELIEEDQLRRTNQAAAEKAEKERKEREEKERQERAAEQAKKDAERIKKEHATVQVNQMETLFSAAAASITPATVKVKITEKIEILHPQGILEIYQMWWMREGNQLPIDELSKIHKKMVTFCEKIANKDDDKINSKYIRYVEEVKAK